MWRPSYLRGAPKVVFFMESLWLVQYNVFWNIGHSPIEVQKCFPLASHSPKCSRLALLYSSYTWKFNFGQSIAVVLFMGTTWGTCWEQKRQKNLAPLLQTKIKENLNPSECVLSLLIYLFNLILIAHMKIMCRV